MIFDCFTRDLRDRASVAGCLSRLRGAPGLQWVIQGRMTSGPLEARRDIFEHLGDVLPVIVKASPWHRPLTNSIHHLGNAPALCRSVAT